jgi:hypothetical protein
MHRLSALLVTVVVGAWSVGPPPRAIIVTQSNSPIAITSYSAAYREGGRYSRDGINHDLQYVNRSTKKIVAIRFGFVSFDAFNQHLGTTGGVQLSDIVPEAKGRCGWIQSAYSDFAFLTGIAYVHKVRFDDDQIWIADMNVVLEELRKIQSDFSAKELEERREPAPRP